jgi:hypothetical protein
MKAIIGKIEQFNREVGSLMLCENELIDLNELSVVLGESKGQALSSSHWQILRKISTEWDDLHRFPGFPLYNTRN